MNKQDMKFQRASSKKQDLMNKNEYAGFDVSIKRLEEAGFEVLLN